MIVIQIITISFLLIISFLGIIIFYDIVKKEHILKTINVFPLLILILWVTYLFIFNWELMFPNNSTYLFNQELKLQLSYILKLEEIILCIDFIFSIFLYFKIIKKRKWLLEIIAIISLILLFYLMIIKYGIWLGIFYSFLSIILFAITLFGIIMGITATPDYF